MNVSVAPVDHSSIFKKGIYRSNTKAGFYVRVVDTQPCGAVGWVVSGALVSLEAWLSDTIYSDGFTEVTDAPYIPNGNTEEDERNDY